MPKKIFKKLYLSDVISLISTINQDVKNSIDISDLQIVNEIQIRDLKGLESTLEIPFQSFAGFQPYKDIYLVSAALWYFLSRTQNFLDCNKRMSILITIYYLSINDITLNTSPRLLYDKTKEVVLSENREKDSIISELSEVIKNNSLPRISS